MRAESIRDYRGTAVGCNAESQYSCGFYRVNRVYMVARACVRVYGLCRDVDVGF